MQDQSNSPQANSFLPPTDGAVDGGVGQSPQAGVEADILTSAVDKLQQAIAQTPDSPRKRMEMISAVRSEYIKDKFGIGAKE